MGLASTLGYLICPIMTDSLFDKTSPRVHLCRESRPVQFFPVRRPEFLDRTCVVNAAHVSGISMIHY